jgi:2-polyprenyl-6-methoxyphenol hydroxylase-like FAD-dependent oxidoreductase
MFATDVLIVGAGPTGLMLANLLSRWGISVRIIDSNQGPAPESRALGVQARTLELMQSLGLAEKFLDRGAIVQGFQMYLKGDRKLQVDLTDMARPDTPFPFIFILPQRETEIILLESLKLQGISVERQHELRSFRQTENEVIAEISAVSGESETIQAKYLVGCDGAHSKTRELLGLSFVGDSYACEFIMADAKVQTDKNMNLALDRISIFLENGAVAILFPIQGNQMSRALAVRLYDDPKEEPKTTATISSPATLPEIQTAFNEISHLQIQLTDPVWVTKYHVHHRSVQTTQVGKAFLAGDASHIHSPVGAQGMNTGLQDAANLAWKLGLALQYKIDVLSTYHSERWPIGQKLLRFTDRVFLAAVTKNPFLIGLRNFILPILARIVGSSVKGKHFVFGFMSELNIHYHQSSVVQERLSPRVSKTFKKTLPAGSRAPNARVSSGREIFDLICGYQFHLLLFSHAEFTETRKQEIQDSWKKFSIQLPFQIHWISAAAAATEAFERYGITDEGLFFIRPDGYIAFRSDDLTSNWWEGFHESRKKK